MMPPLYPGETPPDLSGDGAEAEAIPEPAPAPDPEPAPTPEPVAAQAAAPVAAPQAAAPQKVGPQRPAQRRTPEEILAQREAWLARKAAREAGEEVPAPAPAAPAPVAAAASAPAAKPKPAAKKPAAKKPAARKPAKAEPEIDPNITRRELLNYAWLASIALFSVEAVGFSLWFAFPNFKAGQFGGQFSIGSASEALPEVNSGPVPYTDGKFWLVNVDTEFDGEPRKGVMAIYKVCTHLGCLYEWIPMTGRFECPCHGSKFALTGDYLAGPARRSLDRFVIQAVGPDGSVRAETGPEGGPIAVNDDDQIVIDTGQRILGSSDIVPA